MKTILLFFVCCALSLASYSQVWSADQLAAANTANSTNYLTQVEKDVILYINLSRLYPQQFAQQEVENYYGPPDMGEYVKNSSYRFSLISDLKNLQPMVALQPDDQIYNYAKCFAIEGGNNGIVGHTRINCPGSKYAECASYGMETGKDIALQWLIDDSTPSLGHRRNCLDTAFTKIGASFHTHTKYRYCAIADFQ